MSPAEWHVDERLWQAYAAGRLDEIAEASIDAHVTGCPICRETARSMVQPVVTEALWQGIRDEVRRPELPRVLRWMQGLGWREDDLVLLAAAGGFYLPWALAVGAALVCVNITAMAPVSAEGTFLLLAPLIPVLAVVAAFDATDPLRLLATASPYSKLRLALLRTTTTLAVSFPATMAIGLGLPGLDALAFSWLLPSLALTSCALVLLTWWGPWTAAGAVAVAWSTVVIGTWSAAETSSLTGATVQLGFVLVALLMATALVLRTTTFKLLGGEG
jgi:hypothetical protein